MGIERQTIEAVYVKLQRIGETGDRSGFAELFAERCTFVNPMLDEPIRGREALRRPTETWPDFRNSPEWVVIDGNRLVFGGNERQVGMRDDLPAYRGISTFVFDDDGLVSSYESVFDPAAVVAVAASIS